MSLSNKVEVINEYYTVLEYTTPSIDKARKIYKSIYSTKDTMNLSERFFETANLIESNLFLFVPICKHIDVVTTIIDYLRYYGAQFTFNQLSDTAETYKEQYIPISLMLTVFAMCRHKAMISFLYYAIVKYSNELIITQEIVFYYCETMINDLDNEMILLEDSDLYAVINCLKMMGDLCSTISKIWIHEPIKEKFLSMLAMNNHSLDYSTHIYVDFDFPTHIFRSRQELFTHNTSHKSIMKIISIWSENTVAAKNLASDLNADILYINTHLDFNGGGGVVLVPFAKLLDNFMEHVPMNSIDQTNLQVNNIKPSINAIKYTEYSAKDFENASALNDLFYDGVWQKPVKNMYWKNNNTIFANASNEDIRRCVESAKKGFKNWSANSVASRVERLSNLAKTLSESILSSLTSKYTELACLYENSNGYNIRKQLETIVIRKPRGIIILKEKNKITLFSRLIQCLLAGNSVIVIFNADFCNLTPYIEMFAKSGIPPGVINMLSSEDVTDLESRLCGTEYTVYVRRYFSQSEQKLKIFEKYMNSYELLTLCKQIVHSLK